MRSKKEKIENANQNLENFDFSFLRDVFMSLMYDKNPFPVDFDEAWQWVGFARKDPAKRLLVRKFKQNIDYQSLHFKVEREIGASASEKIYLTVDCFKTFCMMADTKKGDEVRLYYVQLEKDYFTLMEAVKKDLMEEYINARISAVRQEMKEELRKTRAFMDEELKRNLLIMEAWIKEDILPMIEEVVTEHDDRIEVTEDFIKKWLAFQKNESAPADFYLLQEGNDFIFKLGHSLSATIREINLATGNSKPLAVVLTIRFSSTAIARSFEQHLQKFFHEQRIHGEWYHLNSDDLVLIQELSLVYESYHRKMWQKQLT